MRTDPTPAPPAPPAPTPAASNAAGRLDRAQIIDVLSANRMLRLIAPADLAELLSFSRQQVLRSGANLFEEGSTGTDVFVVLTGFMKIVRPVANGHDVVLEVAGPGRVFGELAAINAAPRSADAVALSSARLLGIEGRAWLALLRRSPDAMFEMVRLLSERLRSTTVQMSDALYLPAPARLAKALGRLAALNSRPVRDGLQIEMALSQRELGELSGLARESINKQLSAWRDAGLIRMTGRSLTLTGVESLRQIAEGEAITR